ncbi:uncharacterized protein LOC123205373 [Mangifera indica]|uniref:uncharacterized protein LOC123205373 n=1 Tax=Mangifera indica TaxID=29780 RepID=UPI001CFB51FD|nr:uncharacterized protein LOC123205373 [Mangifera indica]
MNRNTSRPLSILPLLFLFNLRLISALHLNAMLSVDFIPSAGLSTANQWLRIHPLQLQLRYLLRPLLRLLGTLLQIRQLDIAKLSIAAIGVSLEKVKTMASYLANLSRHADYKYDPRMSQSLHLCLDLVDGVGGAVDKIQKSLKQMRDLGAAGSSEERPRSLLFNVQTWITGGPFDHLLVLTALMMWQTGR